MSQPAGNKLSQDVLIMLRNILAVQQVQIGVADFAAVSALAVKALAELDEAINQSG